MAAAESSKASQELFGSVPTGARGTLVALLLVAILKGFLAIFFLYCLFIATPQPPNASNPWIIALAVYIWTVVLLAIAAIILLYNRMRIGKVFALIVGWVCMPGIPLFTILGVFVLGGLGSPGMNQHLGIAEPVPADAS